MKKTGDIRGTFYAKMGMNKDRNGKDLTEAKEIKKSSKNTQKNYTKKALLIQKTITMNKPSGLLEFQLSCFRS